VSGISWAKIQGRDKMIEITHWSIEKPPRYRTVVLVCLYALYIYKYIYVYIYIYILI